MGKVTAWHSAKPECEVYHNNSNCMEQNNIEPYNVREGEGGKRICHHCARLNREEGIRSMSGLVGGMRSMMPRGLMSMMASPK